MEQKQESNKRKNEFKNDRNLESDSDSMEEEEQIDMTKTTKQISNQEQINPTQAYEPQQVVNGTQKIVKGMEEEDEEIQDDNYDMVNVDLNFYDPSEKQFHAIKILVNGYLDGLSFNSSELADIIVKQVIVGTMVGIDDPDESQTEQNVFACTTTLPMVKHSDVKVFKEIANFVSEKSLKHNDRHQELMTVLQNPSLKIGLLINERIVNCSPFVVPTLHTQFLEDLKWVQKEEPEEGKDFQFDYLLVVSKIYKPTQKGQQSQKKQNNNQLKEFIYQKFEDFKFLEQAEQFFMFEAENTKSGGGVTNHKQDIKDQICYRVVYLIKFQNYANAVPLLQNELISGYEEQMKMQQV